MNCVDDLEAEGLEAVGKGAADAVVTDGDDRAVDAEGSLDPWEIIGVAEHLDSVDAPADHLAVGVDEANDIDPAGIEQYVEDHPAVAAASDYEALG
jgi:hypothetical protein